MGAKSKTKAPALAVPQTDEEADALLFDYGTLTRQIDQIQIDFDEALAGLKAEFEERIKPAKEVLSTHFARIQAWGEANRNRLTNDGKTKTVELPSGKIAWRIQPPSVQFKKGSKVEDIVKAILAARFRRKFLRMKLEVNKQAMLDHPDDAKKVEGVKIVSGVEEFYVEPVALELAQAAQ